MSIGSVVMVILSFLISFVSFKLQIICSQYTKYNKPIQVVTEEPKKKKKKKKSSLRDFPGDPVAKIPYSKCRRPEFNLPSGN